VERELDSEIARTHEGRTHHIRTVAACAKGTSRQTETSPDHLASEPGAAYPEIAKRLQVSERMVRNRLHRFNEQGVQGLEEAPRSGRLVTYQPEIVSEIIQTAL